MYKFLKNSRLVISLVFLALITLSFIFITKDGTTFFATFLKFQFVPSILGAITGSVFFLISLIVLTLCFGRLYCSTLCPLGTLQDIFTRISNLFKTKKQRRFSYSNPKNALRYGILSIIGLPFVFGITLPLLFLDPYSNYGRIANQLIRGSEILLNNSLSEFFPETLYHKAFTGFMLGSFIFSVIFLIVIMIFSSIQGRLYCNTICPVGSILGLFSKFSLLKPVLSSTKCNHCKACTLKCKSQCIDIDNQKIDQTRCVTCFNCMQSCKNGAISYSFAFGKNKVTLAPDKMDKNNDLQQRRGALIAIGIVGTAIAARALNKVQLSTAKPNQPAIIPPGAVSIEHLKRQCTSCHACIAACPNGIIKPSSMELGIDGVMLPILSFKKQFCGYECNACTQVCPNGALLPMTIEDKKLSQIGQAEFILENCIVPIDKTDCGACDEHCPTKAITMVPYGDTSLFIPNLNQEICIGCGGCEYICPAASKAMVVKGKQVHGVAKKPLKEEQKKVKVDEFGF